MLSQNRYEDISSLFSDKKNLVIGDLMLYSYYYGKTERMSPEAPVPVVDVIMSLLSKISKIFTSSSFFK